MSRAFVKVLIILLHFFYPPMINNIVPPGADVEVGYVW